MKIGKLPNSVLENLIDGIKNREEVIVGSQIGKDAAVLDFEEKLVVLSTDPITGTSKDLGHLSINISVNDLATEGAEPVAAIMTILAPEGTQLEEIEEIMEDAKKTASEMNLAIVGGHTEITDAVNRIVVSTAVLGSIDGPYHKPEFKTNDLVVLTKNIGLEGSSIIVKEKPDEMKNLLTPSEYREALSYSDLISVVPEGLIGKKYGAKYMHDITEGGVLGACWEAAKANDTGMIIFDDRLPVTEVTKKICSYYKIDPRKLISSGSMLMIISQEDFIKLVVELEKVSVKATVVGRITDYDGVFIKKDDKLIPVGEPGPDELYSVV